MKAFANWLMKGRMQAVIAATVLAMLALIVTPVALVSAAVVALTVLRQGWREGALVVVSALLALAGLGGLVFQMPLATTLVGATLYGVLLWLPAALLGGVMGRSGSLRVAIEAAVIGAAVIVVAQYVLLEDPVAFWRAILDEFVAARLPAETLSAANVEPLLDAMAGWMPGGIAASWFLGSVLSLCLARYWNALLDRPGAFGEEFRALRFGRWLLLLTPLLLVAGLLLSGSQPHVLSQFLLLGMTVFLIQGISLAHGLVALLGVPKALLIGLYLVLIFVAPQGATLVSVAGYVDGWLNFRARVRARRATTDDN